MKILKKNLQGVLEVQLKSIEDERGFFMRVFDKKIFKENLIENIWVQENHSLSMEKHTLRGLHFQLPPYTEAKLIRVIKGKILDVYVDLRTDSKTFGQWGSTEISAKQKNMLLIPRGFAHGFLTLDENTEVSYKVDNYYTPDFESGIIWNDETLNINWNCNDPLLSEKDQNQQTLNQFLENHNSITV